MPKKEGFKMFAVYENVPYIVGSCEAGEKGVTLC